jgi:hypothetical protein
MFRKLSLLFVIPRFVTIVETFYVEKGHNKQASVSKRRTKHRTDPSISLLPEAISAQGRDHFYIFAVFWAGCALVLISVFKNSGAAIK